MTSFARAVSGLPDTVVQSEFHRLKRQAKQQDLDPPTRFEVDKFCRTMGLYIAGDDTLSHAHRQNLIERLDRARNEPPPDAATWYAIKTIHSRVITGTDPYTISQEADELAVELATYRRRAQEGKRGIRTDTALGVLKDLHRAESVLNDEEPPTQIRIPDNAGQFAIAEAARLADSISERIASIEESDAVTPATRARLFQAYRYVYAAKQKIDKDRWGDNVVPLTSTAAEMLESLENPILDDEDDPTEHSGYTPSTAA